MIDFTKDLKDSVEQIEYRMCLQVNDKNTRKHYFFLEKNSEYAFIYLFGYLFNYNEVYNNSETRRKMETWVSFCFVLFFGYHQC